MSDSAGDASEPEVPAWDQPPTETEPRPPKPRSDWWRLVKLFAILAACLALGAQLLWTVGNHFFPPEVLSDIRESSKPQQEYTAETERPKLPPSRIIDAGQAVQRSKLMRAQADLQTAQELIGQVRQQISNWDETVPRLLSGDNKRSRSIAADNGATRLFLGALDRERISQSELESLREALLALAVPLEAAVEDNSVVLKMGPEFTTEISDITERLRSGLKSWQEDNAVVRLLAKEAEERPAGELTLGEAIEQLRANETRRRAEKIDEEVAAAKVALDEKEAASRMRLRDLETQKNLEADKVKAQRREAELAGLKAEQLVLADRIEEQRKRTELERRFQAELPEIRRILTAFITPGHKQIVNGKWRRVEQKQPISLSGLHATRTLGDDSMSQMYLYHAGGSDRNDRPNGPFRDYIGGHLRDHETALVQKVRRFLLDYGDLMVEKGLLMP